MLLPFAERLYAVAEAFLRHADFALVTDSNGKILYSNGAFLLLISPKSGDRAKLTERQTGDMRSRKQKEWEKVLEDAPVGSSQVVNRSEIEDWREWNLNRTEIEDRASNRSFSYLNVLRLSAVPPLNEESLREIDEATACLIFYVPSLVFAELDDIEASEGNLLKTIDRLEELVRRNQ